jgi:hypothetical protein
MRQKPLFLIIALALLIPVLGLTACNADWLALPTQTPIPPTSTITATTTSTATRVWFPPTATNTPVPGEVDRTPIPDLRPLENDIIVMDQFDEKSQWELTDSDSMVARYGVNELTLALKQTKGTLYSFNLNPVPDDYYLALKIEPNLCTGSDQYGILFRAQSRQEFYRVMMSCQGNIRLDLVNGNSAVPLVETNQSAQIFSGPDALIRLNLWMVDGGVQVFINDVLQLEYYRLQWLDGDIGVFARSTGENALTVSFSELILREVNPLPPTPTPTLTAAPD